jgi:hypothetical protein
MTQSPPEVPTCALRTSPIEEAVTTTLRLGQHYAGEFAKLVKLAVMVQYMQVSNLDCTAVVAQLKKVAEEARVNLELELDQFRQLCDELLPQLEALAAAEDETEACAFGSSTTTRH